MAGLPAWADLTNDQRAHGAATVHALRMDHADRAAVPNSTVIRWWAKKRTVKSIDLDPPTAITEPIVFLDGYFVVVAAVSGQWNLGTWRNGGMPGDLQLNLERALERQTPRMGATRSAQIVAAVEIILDMLAGQAHFAATSAAREIVAATPLDLVDLSRKIVNQVKIIDDIAYELAGEEFTLAKDSGNLGVGLRLLEANKWPAWMEETLRDMRKKLSNTESAGDKRGRDKTSADAQGPARPAPGSARVLNKCRKCQASVRQDRMAKHEEVCKGKR